MAKRTYIVKDGYLAFPDRNVYAGSEIELEESNPGTKVLLERGAIELVVKARPRVQQEEEE